MLRKAKPLSAPAPVGIIAPASAPRTEQSLTLGLQNLVKAGFRPVLKRESFNAHGFLAGTDAERLTEFNSFLRSDEVDALFCVRGGYGCLRLLDDIDYEAARAHPKVLVGYSDITALHLALFKHAGWIGISGPMVAVEWPNPDEANCEQFLRLISGSLSSGPLDSKEHPLSSLFSGSVEGTLLGGNLSLITKMCGSEHLPDLTGAILFLEDIGESPYRIDSLFAQLKLSGHLSLLGGVVLGSFTDAEPLPGRPTLELKQVFEDYFRPLNIPVAMGLRYGHHPEKVAIPIGVQARLHCDEGQASLEILESAVL
ncbi:LD-carboxypeptidase [bacterium]|nr:LD-carboxypeptidase [bacterium]